jgi:antitoxin VapB
MALNIKDPETHALAQALAQVTGETMSKAVTEAIRERLERVRRSSRPETLSADLLAIGKRCADTLNAPPVDHGSLLYNEHGLPK